MFGPARTTPSGGYVDLAHPDARAGTPQLPFAGLRRRVARTSLVSLRPKNDDVGGATSRWPVRSQTVSRRAEHRVPFAGGRPRERIRRRAVAVCQGHGRPDVCVHEYVSGSAGTLVSAALPRQRDRRLPPTICGRPACAVGAFTARTVTVVVAVAIARPFETVRRSRGRRAPRRNGRSGESRDRCSAFARVTATRTSDPGEREGQRGHGCGRRRASERDGGVRRDRLCRAGLRVGAFGATTVTVVVEVALPRAVETVSWKASRRRRADRKRGSGESRDWARQFARVTRQADVCVHANVSGSAGTLGSVPLPLSVTGLPCATVCAAPACAVGRFSARERHGGGGRGGRVPWLTAIVKPTRRSMRRP